MPAACAITAIRHWCRSSITKSWSKPWRCTSSATFQAGVTFARAEGIIPAPESNHAIAACIDEALRCKESGEAKTLFFNLSGHGHFDMGAYDSYFSGKLEDFAYPEEAIKAALDRLPKVG